MNKKTNRLVILVVVILAVLGACAWVQMVSGISTDQAGNDYPGYPPPYATYEVVGYPPPATQEPPVIEPTAIPTGLTGFGRLCIAGLPCGE